ncbi:hypothetical protein EVAR_85314_1 [Eumeta japonica]|uniref:Uncharacterized protein n=1 Tax=Eumeta variegata TaxID=151549 RepID=A0A4C1V9H7_EUMVA|nr:hypothetical protein EVAR_85314_1 [Eumeta japonica]
MCAQSFGWRVIYPKSLDFCGDHRQVAINGNVFRAELGGASRPALARGLCTDDNYFCTPRTMLQAHAVKQKKKDKCEFNSHGYTSDTTMVPFLHSDVRNPKKYSLDITRERKTCQPSRGRFWIMTKSRRKVKRVTGGRRGRPVGAAGFRYERRFRGHIDREH